MFAKRILKQGQPMVGLSNGNDRLHKDPKPHFEFGRSIQNMRILVAVGKSPDNFGSENSEALRTLFVQLFIKIRSEVQIAIGNDEPFPGYLLKAGMGPAGGSDITQVVIGG